MADAARSAYIQMAWRVNSTGYHRLMNQFDAADRRSDTSLGRMDRRLTKVGNSMLEVGQKTKVLSAAMGGVLAYGVSQAAKLQNRYKVITNLLTTGGEKAAEATRNVKRMQQQSLGISNKYGVSQQQIGKGYEELVRRGYSSNQALAAQKTFVKGAIASGDDYADVVKNSTSALEAFGLRSKNTATMTRNTSKVVNEMAYAADLTATDFKNLGYGMTYVGATGKTTNQSVGHVAAALGELSNNGQEATVAGTGLRKVYNSLAAPGPKSGIPALASIGLSPKDLLNSKGKMKDLAAIFLQFNKKMKGMSSNEKFNFFHTFFGTTGQTSAMLLSQNAKNLQKLQNQVDKAPKKNYINQLANKNMKTTLQQWKIFKQNIINTATVMGGRLLPAANDAIKGVSGLTKWFDQLNDSSKKWVTYGAIGIAAFSPVMTLTGILLKNFRTLRSVVTGTWTAIQKVNRISSVSSVFGKSNRTEISPTPKGQYTDYSQSKQAREVRITAQRVVVSGSTRSQGGLSVNPNETGEKVGRSAGRWMYADAAKTGRKVGTSSSTYMVGKAAKTGRKIGRTMTSYSYSDSARVGRKIGTTSTRYSYSGATKVGKRSGRAFASTSYASMGKTGRRGGRIFGGAVMGLGWLQLGSDVGGHAKTAIKYGLDSKKGGRAMWEGGGATVGGAIGSTFGPIGMIVGEQIGEEAGKAFSKFATWTMKNGPASPGGNNTRKQRAYNATHTSSVSIAASTNAGGAIGVPNVPVKKTQTRTKIAGINAPGHANGSFITKPETAVVGENGYEIHQRGQKFTIVGKRGAQLIQTKPGDHIYKHSDAIAMANGSYSKRLPGYAGGTTNTTSSTVSSTSGTSKTTTKKLGNLSSTEKKTKSSMKKISGSITSGYSKSTSKANKSISKFNSKSSSGWKSIVKDSNKQTSKVRRNTIQDYDQMQKGSQKQMTQLHKGMNSAAKATTSDFGDIMGRLKPYAHKAMGGAISSLNGGISGINSTLSQFGGNKSVLKPIHYAAGSKGPIGSDQMAVLNDAKSGPRQELVARGDTLLKPEGQDVLTPLKKGDQVLNGSQVEQAKPYLPHFAKGTGVSNQKLLSLIEKNSSKPDDAWKNDFTNHAKDNPSSQLGSGVSSLSKKAANNKGVPWNNAAWSVMNDAAQSGGSGAGGTWRHDPGMAKSNGFGASRSFGSHDGVDFSGPQGTPIKAVHGGVVTRAGKPVWDFKDLGYVVTVKSDDGYQEIYQEFGDSSHIRAHVGQTIKTGDTVATQGGIIGSSTGPHVHIGVSKGSLWDHGGSSTRGWYDVTKMHGKSTGLSKKKKADTGLQKYAKNQLKAAGVLPWITKHIMPLTEDDSGSGGTSAAPSGSHKHWLQQAGIPESWWPITNEIISAESGWNPKAHNSSGAYGLPQSLPASKMASAGSDWRTNPITQLKWYKSYIKSRYGSIGHAISFRHAHGWYKSGGNPPANQPVMVGEEGPELATFGSGAHIHNNHETKSMLRGAKSSPDVTVNLTVNVKGSADKGTPKSIAKEVKNVLVNLFTNELGNDFG